MSEELKPSDIVDRLRKPNRVSDWAAMLEAANLIEKLRAEIAAWNRRASPTTEGEGGGEDAREIAQRVIDTWGDGNPPIVVLARALLSSPDARREALEEAREALQLFHDHYPHGVNPWLDEVYSKAGTFLRALKEAKP